MDEEPEALPETEMGVAQLSGGCGQVANQLVDRGGQVVFGVHWSAVLSHLEMEMRAGGPARVPHAADGLPLPHRVPLVGDDDREVRIHRAHPAPVLEHDRLSQGPRGIAGVNHLAVRGGLDLLVMRGADSIPAWNFPQRGPKGELMGPTRGH